MLYRERINHKFRPIHYVGVGVDKEHKTVFAYREFEFRPYRSDGEYIGERIYKSRWKLVWPIRVDLLIRALFNKEKKYDVDKIKLEITARNRK